MHRFTLALLVIVFTVAVAKNKNPHFLENRSTIVHLFEWKWSDIALECEGWLGPRGYGGVQTSPVSENLNLTSQNRTWWERYEPISYKLKTRSGNETGFIDMVQRCNAVGVRIYPDIVINHMTATWLENEGTGGSTATFDTWDYPAVPYTKKDFNDPICYITDYTDPKIVRNCQIFGLKDLNQGSQYVRDKIVEFMNKLIDYGVAGFRIDAAKHMWPKDLEAIYDRLNDLNTDHNFPPGSRPFIYQEVHEVVGEPITTKEYTPIGAVTEFKASVELGKTFRGFIPIERLQNWGVGWGLVPDGDGIIFIDNHFNQRGYGPETYHVINYKQPKEYESAVAFILAHPYGVIRVMSSFAFNDPDVGPPMDADHEIRSPLMGTEVCARGWVCEHRWESISGMVGFRNEVLGQPVLDWRSYNGNQIAFCRGDRGFIAINTHKTHHLEAMLQTCLPPGTYCDVISGGKDGDKCFRKTIIVDSLGFANISIRATYMGPLPGIAIHVGASSRLT